MIDIIGYEQLNKILWNEKDSDNIIILYFGTSWCGPCKKLKDRIESEKKEVPLLKVLYLDCDAYENEQIVEDYKIESLPTQIFVHLEDKNVVKDHKIEGFDWIGLIFAYNEIIEKRNNYDSIEDEHASVKI